MCIKLYMFDKNNIYTIGVIKQRLLFMKVSDYVSLAVYMVLYQNKFFKWVNMFWYEDYYVNFS